MARVQVRRNPEFEGQSAARLLVGLTVAGVLWVGLSLAAVSAAEATPQQYANALQYAIGKELQQPGYTIHTVVVRPYHPLQLAKGDRIWQFQVWVAYTHRGQSHVMYLVIFPDGDVIDQTIVTSVGDTGGLVG
jgi:hypothetical protein